MKISTMMAMAVLAGTFARADEKMGIAERGVTICFETRATPEASLAQVIAIKMFANIGMMLNRRYRLRTRLRTDFQLL